MQSLFFLLTTAASVASAGLLFATLKQLERIHSALDQIGDVVRNGPGCHGPPQWYGMLGSPAGYAIYIYRDGKWTLDADLSRPGYEATPPSMQAAYEGQVVKRESAPIRAGQ